MLALALVALAGASGGVYAWSFTDRVAFLPPLLGWPLTIRQDAHGRGLFGAPRSGRRQHNGVDLSSSVGTPVRAVKGGWVAIARTHKGLGNYIMLWHGRGLGTVYAHLSRMDVTPGQRVRQGQVIGAVGKTGNARARDIVPHLHFEIRQHGRPLDPLERYLKPYVAAQEPPRG